VNDPRHLEYLRVSVTPGCALSCLYCTPTKPADCVRRAGASAAGLALAPSEIEQVVRAAQHLGVTHVRLTGGEPLSRPDLPEIIGRLGRLGLPDLALTTNGIGLADRAALLARAGLRRMNVSLPHLTAEGYRRVTGADALDAVLAGLEAAEGAGLRPLKTNTVVLRGLNDDVLDEFAAFGRTRGVVTRFIEFMASDDEDRARYFVPASEVLARLRQRFRLTPLHGGVSPAPGPARYWRVDGGGAVGLIAPVTAPFCGACTRLRLTADGRLRACLFGPDEVDLAPLLAAGAPGDTLLQAFRRVMAAKPMTHPPQLPHAMRMIGG
jgi:cyclic pyranopterin phosphate synthase